MKASLGDDINLDGGVTARVVDGAGVDLSDSHGDELDGSDQSTEEGEEEREERGRTGLIKGRERQKKRKRIWSVVGRRLAAGVKPWCSPTPQKDCAARRRKQQEVVCRVDQWIGQRQGQPPPSGGGRSIDPSALVYMEWMGWDGGLVTQLDGGVAG